MPELVSNVLGVLPDDPYHPVVTRLVRYRVGHASASAYGIGYQFPQAHVPVLLQVHLPDDHTDLLHHVSIIVRVGYVHGRPLLRVLLHRLQYDE
ncbi:hypothetical protein SDC9_201988 [bioreactor metagenome]|uniref:Uncharacterized protein n=1 Tax=bioreactor metagenome TaxID=1076179 RepID=A0A645ISF6_9ZZZZ